MPYKIAEEEAAYKKDYYEKNKEDRLAYKKDYYEKNKESIAAYQKAYREENKDAILFRRRGITLTEKNKIQAEQGNKCKICYQDFSADVKPVVDHCHTSGKVRGLLCNNCNVGLGMFQDNPLVFIKAAEYLKEQGEEAPPEGN